MCTPLTFLSFRSICCSDEGDRDQRIFWTALGGEVEIRPADEVDAEPEYVKKLFR